jgi:glycosyltransferase involved in cell wall biosynthesis
MAEISIIMPVYNAEKYIEEAIKSVLSQTFRDFELIIVNDASPDNSERIIKGFKDKRIRYFKHKTNKGKCRANNFGMKKAKGKYWQIFDADDLMANYKLAVQKQILDANPKAGLVYGHVLKIDEKGRLIGPWNIPFKRKGTPKHTIMQGFIEKKFDIRKMRMRCCINTSNTLFRKEVIKKVGFFDENLKVAEDWDYFLRTAEKFRIVFYPAVFSLYRIHKKGLYQIAQKKKTAGKYKKIVIEKMKKRLGK